MRLLVGLGHDVTEDAPEFDGEAFAIAFVTVIAAETRAELMNATRLLGRPLRRADVELATWVLGMFGEAESAADYARAVNFLQLTGRIVGRFLERYDVLLTPTLADPPPLIGALQPSPMERRAMSVIAGLHAGWLLNALDLLRPIAKRTLSFIPYTPVSNVTGQPAMSVPLYWNTAGLPVGVHFATRLGGEPLLFRLAAQLERARPWFDHVPATNGIR